MRTNRKVKSHRYPSFGPEQLRSPCAPCQALKYLFILHIFKSIYIEKEKWVYKYIIYKETMSAQL